MPRMAFALDPGPPSGGTFAATLERPLGAIEAEEGARLPGAGRHERRVRTEIELGDAALADLKALAAGWGPPCGRWGRPAPRPRPGTPAPIGTIARSARGRPGP